MVTKFIISTITLFLFQNSLNLEYSKNKDIKLREQSNMSYVNNITNTTQLTQIFKREKHIIMLFISDWCVSCPDTALSFFKASGYNFTRSIADLYLIDCYRGNELCSNYNITKYPSKRVYLYNKPKFIETTAVPNGDSLEDILEYIDKIGSKPLIKLSSMKSVNKFSKDHGDVSYLLIMSSIKDENEELLSCYSSIALLPFNRPQYYFAYINEKHFHNHYDMKIPSILLLGINKEFNINKAIASCGDIEGFVTENQYPLMKRIDLQYLNKLYMRRETIIIVTINKESISQVQHIMTLVQNIAVNRRDLIFGYLDVNKDKDVLLFFNQVEEESVIVYDFGIGKYYIDTYKDNTLKIKDIVNMLDEGRLRWKSGYFIEDFISGLGIQWSRTTVIFIVFCMISIIVLIVFFFICSCINSIDKKFKIN